MNHDTDKCWKSNKCYGKSRLGTRESQRENKEQNMHGRREKEQMRKIERMNEKI